MEPKANPDIPTREAALLSIKYNAKHAEEAAHYSAAAKKLNDLAHTLANASRTFPLALWRP